MEHLFDHAASSTPLDDLLKQLHLTDPSSAIPQDDAFSSLLSDANMIAPPHDADWNAPTFDAAQHESPFDPTNWQDPAHLSSEDMLTSAFETHLPDVTLNDLTASPHLDSSQQHDWTTLPDLHYHDVLPHNEPHAQHFTFHASSDFKPYTTINDDGSVYKHTESHQVCGDYVGDVDGRNVYNSHLHTSNHYLGHGSLDGKVYDSHDHYVGRMDTYGHIYNAAGEHVHDTNRGVAGAAAYLLLCYLGGVQ